jgi:ferredoxin-NADP reductase
MANPYFTKAKVTFKEFIKTTTNTEPNLLKITIKLTAPESKPFRPGQFCTFRVGEGFFRAYSIASSYKNFEEYEFLISCGHEGIGANYFRNLNIGDEVVFLGPNGHFKIIVPVEKNILFLATGTGISPYISMIEFLMDNSCDTNIQLIHGFRDESNLNFYKDLHNNFKDKCTNFSSKIFISKPTSNANNDFEKGRVTDYLKNLNLTSLQDTQIYLCGHPDMIDESVEFLVNNGFNMEKVMYEAFTSPGAYEKIN